MLTQRLFAYEQANVSRMTYDHMRTSNVQMDDENVWGFTRNGVLAMAVDQQAFPDPADAERFVLSLPVADRHGNGGIDITLLSDEGVKALANSALIGADGDLSDQHAVISHLPETTSWGERGAVTQNGGVRNQLITGFYDVLATRADGLFAGDLAGMPNVPGHPGANWLMFAPWASNGVGGAITGETGGPLGITTSGVMQAAADGNQFIFDDIGGRFANFIELYEANPNPSEAQLEGFFAGQLLGRRRHHPRRIRRLRRRARGARPRAAAAPHVRGQHAGRHARAGRCAALPRRHRGRARQHRHAVRPAAHR